VGGRIIKKMKKRECRAFRGPKAEKSAYFTHPDFSAAKLEKKSGQITRVNTVHSLRDIIAEAYTSARQCLGLCNCMPYMAHLQDRISTYNSYNI
jgi:hypothetical protein